MKIKQTILVIGALLTSFIGVATISPQVAADNSCGVATSIITCKTPVNNKSNDVRQNAIWVVLVWILNIMVAGVGILAVAGIAWAAVLYASAGDSAEQVKRAKTIITNVVIGLVTFGLMYSVLNFLMPGGLFHA